MAINRRTALRNLGLITGGILFLPGCFKTDKPLSVQLKNLTLTGTQDTVLRDLVGTIIPKGKLSGANDIGVSDFVLKMVDDCESAENQRKFQEGFVLLERRSQNGYQKQFPDLTQQEKIDLLKTIQSGARGADGKPVDDPLAGFISMVKRYTTQGYMQSQYIMTEVIPYTMIPGRFYGCIAIDKNKKILQG